MRCLTLADALQGEGWDCVFLSSKETLETCPSLKHSNYTVKNDECLNHADWLILDHYDLDASYETQARNWSNQILVIDDLANRKHDCDILVDQTYGRNTNDYKELVPEQCQILAGAQYALLRPQFSEHRSEALKRREKEAVESILLFISGSDPQNVTTRVLQALEGYSDQLNVNTIIGGGAPYLEEIKKIISSTKHNVVLYTDVQNMADFMTKADIAIGAGGTTSWERCALGLPALVVEIADNQSKIIQELDKAEAIINLGWYENINDRNILEQLKMLIINHDKRHILSQHAASICDGSGVDHVISIMKEHNN